MYDNDLWVHAWYAEPRMIVYPASQPFGQAAGSYFSFVATKACAHVEGRLDIQGLY